MQYARIGRTNIEVSRFCLTKPFHIDGMAEASELVLTADEIAYLEEPYVPHALVGVMAQNKA